MRRAWFGLAALIVLVASCGDDHPAVFDAASDAFSTAPPPLTDASPPEVVASHDPGDAAHDSVAVDASVDAPQAATDADAARDGAVDAPVDAPQAPTDASVVNGGLLQAEPCGPRSPGVVVSLGPYASYPPNFLEFVEHGRFIVLGVVIADPPAPPPDHDAGLDAGAPSDAQIDPEPPHFTIAGVAELSVHADLQGRPSKIFTDQPLPPVGFVGYFGINNGDIGGQGLVEGTEAWRLELASHPKFQSDLERTKDFLSFRYQRERLAMMDVIAEGTITHIDGPTLPPREHPAQVFVANVIVKRVVCGTLPTHARVGVGATCSHACDSWVLNAEEGYQGFLNLKRQTFQGSDADVVPQEFPELRIESLGGDFAIDVNLLGPPPELDLR